ncbi:MAG: ATP-dependent DNA helicase RecG [Alcaligenaceae bacterium]|nr:ATP-dependent DNA helicase RecG [Alcaligenaceae bacterium]
MMPSSKKPTLTATDKKLHALGLVEPMDFILHIPLRYEDHSRIHQISELAPGMKAQLEGTVSSIQVVMRGRKQLSATFNDQSGSIQLRWLNFYPSQKTVLEKKGLFRIRGEIRGSFQWGLEMIHPKMLKAGESLGDSLVPIYPTTAGLSQEVLSAHIQKHLKNCVLQETLSDEIRQRYELMEINQAIQILHQPPLGTDIESLEHRYHPAWERLKFDEMLAQQIAMFLARQKRSALKAYAVSTQKGDLYQQVLDRFSFQLTAAQVRVLAEIDSDLQRDFPMHRLIQGDVGSGKTIVAALAATSVLEQGLQVALMAPTEILAEQHYRKICQWLEGSGVTVYWLSSSVKSKEKRETYEAIANGQAKFIIGTQALIQKDVRFQQLGLVIVDEQHRFGVGQRLSLSEKGVFNEEVAETVEIQENLKMDLLQPAAIIYPHQLNMSATPIPRTLAMTFLSDLDVSVIDELPPGRQAVETKLLDNKRRDELISLIESACHQGKQVYWVCPLVEESEALQLQTAEETYDRLSAELDGVRVALVHGRLKSEEKNQIMADFQAHHIDVLVATTVIEVGVDVPNANIMVIEHAERFGLAQLHQLRGRVGRGQDKAICLLLYQQPLSELAKQRLKAMYETTDGFEIARRDLEQRGPGEFLGLKQSGTSLTRFINIDEDVAIVEEARAFAPQFIKDNPAMAVEHQRRWVGMSADYLRS